MSENLQIPTFTGHMTKCELHDDPDEAYIFIDVARGTENLCTGAAMVSLPGVGIQPLTGLHYSAKKVTKYRMYEQLAEDCFTTLVDKQRDPRYAKNTDWVLVTDNHQLAVALENEDPALAGSADALLAANQDIEVVVIDWTPDQDCPCMQRVRAYATTLLRQKQKLKAKNMKHYRPDIDRKMRGGHKRSPEGKHSVDGKHSAEEKRDFDKKRSPQPKRTCESGGSDLPDFDTMVRDTRSAGTAPAFQAPGQRRTFSVSEDDVDLTAMPQSKKHTQQKHTQQRMSSPGNTGARQMPKKPAMKRQAQKRQTQKPKIHNNPFMQR